MVCLRCLGWVLAGAGGVATLQRAPEFHCALFHAAMISARVEAGGVCLVGRVPTCDGAARCRSLSIPALSPGIPRRAGWPSSSVAAVSSLSPAAPACCGPDPTMSPQAPTLSRIGLSSAGACPAVPPSVPTLSRVASSLSRPVRDKSLASPAKHRARRCGRKASPSSRQGAHSGRAARNASFSAHFSSRADSSTKEPPAVSPVLWTFRAVRAAA